MDDSETYIQLTASQFREMQEGLTAARACIRDLARELSWLGDVAESYYADAGDEYGKTKVKEATATLAKHKTEIEKSGTKPTLPR